MKRSILAAMACFAALSSTASAQSVVTYHNAPDRSGDYIVPGLTAAAAANLHQDSNFHAILSGNIYAQPLYWKPSGAKIGLLIVATESNFVYALNADTGAPIWKTQVAPSAPVSALECGIIDPEGVNGTPVIDPASGTLYLDALTLTSNNVPLHKIFALSLSDGKVLPHWPVNVDAAMAARHAAFASNIQGERSALQFLGGKLYVNYAGRYGDCGPYHGTVIEFDTATQHITGSWETRAQGGGIWGQSGVASDGVSLFATTGNTMGASGWQDGEAVVRLAPGLARSINPKNYFAPANWAYLDAHDIDLGGTSAVPFTIPTSASTTASRIIALGKDGHAYLLDAANLGGIGHELANVQVSNTEIKTAAAIYNAKYATFVAFTNDDGLSGTCSGNSLTMLRVTDAAKGPVAIDWCAQLNGHGAPIITTTNGTANPIVWVAGAEGDGQLHGFSAVNGKTVFAGGGVSMNNLHRFSTLIAADRHLYVAADGTVYAFTF